ncbi:MAG: hypothetical protein WCP19_06605 [Chloroflexota bacterium]
MSDNFEFFFPDLDPNNSGIIPLPPADMKLINLSIEPVIDEGPLRIRVLIETTPFQIRPYIEVNLLDGAGDEIASASIIEPMQRKNVFTMHIKGGQKTGKFMLQARLYYPEKVDSDLRELTFEI